METVEIFNILKNSFNALWNYKVRGNTMEVITPYSTTNDKFISIFITHRNGEYIASDGGWLNNEFYEATVDLSDEYYSKLFHHYESYFDVQIAVGSLGEPHFFKKTKQLTTVANIVYELANFISSIISASFIQFQDKVENDERDFFTREANAFIGSLAKHNNVKLNQSLGENLKNIRFSAVVRYPQSKLAVVNYITGSTYSYFQSSVARANLNFEIASKSAYNQLIVRKIAFINDKAEGFKQDKLYEYLNILESHTDTPNIRWSERARLSSYL